MENAQLMAMPREAHRPIDSVNSDDTTNGTQETIPSRFSGQSRIAETPEPTNATPSQSRRIIPATLLEENETATSEPALPEPATVVPAQPARSTHSKAIRKFLDDVFSPTCNSFPDRIDSKEWQCRRDDFRRRAACQLAQHMRKAHKRCSVHLRFMAIGECSSSAELYAIILCEEHAVGTTKRFFETDSGKQLCLSNDPSQPSVKVAYYGGEFPFKAAEVLELLGASPRVKSRHNITSCGTLVKNCTLSGGPRYATLGGLLTVTIPNVPPKIVGLTAGHFLETMGTDDHTKFDPMCLDNHYQTRLEGYQAGNDPQLELPTFEAASYEQYRYNEGGITWSKLGSTSDKSRSSRELNRDWALVENIEGQFRLPNLLPGGGNPLTQVGRFEEFGNASCLPSSDIEVFVLSNGDQYRGFLSGSPSLVLLPSGNDFVDIYTMSLEGDLSLPVGCSGSWVINTASSTVYGHVVAEDPLGSILVVPLQHILDDIRETFKATSVALTVPQDLLPTVPIFKSLLPPPPPPPMIGRGSEWGTEWDSEWDSGRVICPNCGQVLTGPHAAGNLTRHRKTCGMNAKKVSCTFCGKAYARSDSMHKHERNAHGAV